FPWCAGCRRLFRFRDGSTGAATPCARVRIFDATRSRKRFCYSGAAFGGSAETVQKSQFTLLGEKRFAPFFATQFLGAFNDNVFRNGLVILLIFEGVNVGGLEASTLANVAGALFILPFFLFSAIAGQLADKYEKSMLLRRIKFAEILIMCAGAIGFYFDAVYFLLAVLFCMGLQSTFFGPIKYSIIPQHLNDKELVSGNALVEMGTFLAILLGSIAGVVLKMEGTGEWV